MPVEELIAELRLDQTKFSTGMQQAARQAQTGSQQIERQFQRVGRRFTVVEQELGRLNSRLGGFGVLLQQLGPAGIAAGAGMATLTLGMSQAVRAGVGFERSLANVATLIDTSTGQLERFRAQIIALPANLGTARELTDALYQALSAGVEPARAVEFVGQAARLAVAGLTDAFTAVDILTTAINAYGLEASDAANVSDTLFKTVELGKTTLGELASALGRVFPISAQLGVSIAEVNAAVASLTAGGISTNEAVTALRSTFASFVQQADKFRDVGIDILRVIRERGLLGALQALKDITDGNIEEIRTFVPEIEALNAVLSLAGQRTDDFTDKLDALRDASGATATAFGKQQAGLGAALREFNNELDRLAQTVAPQALKDFAALTRVATNFIRALRGDPAIGSVEEIAQRARAGVTAREDELTRTLEAVSARFEALLNREADILAQLPPSVRNLPLGSEEFQRRTGGAGPATQANIKALGAVRAELTKVADQIVATQDALEALQRETGALDALGDAATRAADAQADLTNMTQRMARAERVLIDGLAEFYAEYFETRTEASAIAREGEFAALEAMTEAERTLIEGMADVYVENANRQIAEAERAAFEQRRLLQSLAFDVSSFIQDIPSLINGDQDLAQGLGQFAANLVGTAARTMLPPIVGDIVAAVVETLPALIGELVKDESRVRFLSTQTDPGPQRPFQNPFGGSVVQTPFGFVGISGTDIAGRQGERAILRFFRDLDESILGYLTVLERELVAATVASDPGRFQADDVTAAIDALLVDRVQDIARAVLGPATANRLLFGVTSGVEAQAELERALSLRDAINAFTGEGALSDAERQLNALTTEFEDLRREAERLAMPLDDLIASYERQRAKLTLTFEQDIAQQLLAITDPFAAALADLERQQLERLENARVLGADLVDVERLNILERQELLRQQGEQERRERTAALAQAQQQLAQEQQQIEQFLFGLAAGPSSPFAAPVRRSAALEAFRGAGTTGDAIQAAEAFLAASRSQFASSATFFADVSLIQGALQQRLDELTVDENLLAIQLETLQDIDAGQDRGNRILQAGLDELIRQNDATLRVLERVLAQRTAGV